MKPRLLSQRQLHAYLITAVLGLCLVAFPPLLATLELHHQLGAADQDGHQHSAADLCSWVQSHASCTVVDAVPIPVSRLFVSAPTLLHKETVVSRLRPSDLPARGPPALFV